VEAAIGGLSPATLYHYRLVATNRAGTTLGADRTFTSVRPSRITLAASPGTVVFGQSTTLTGTVVTARPIRTTVTLQRSRSFFGPFFNVASTITTSKGAFAFGPYPFTGEHLPPGRRGGRLEPAGPGRGPVPRVAVGEHHQPAARAARSLPRTRAPAAERTPGRAPAARSRSPLAHAPAPTVCTRRPGTSRLTASRCAFTGTGSGAC